MPLFSSFEFKPHNSIGTSSYIFYPETPSEINEVGGFFVQTWVGIGSMGNQSHSLSSELKVHSQALQIKNVSKYCDENNLPDDTHIVKLPPNVWTKLTVLLGAWSGLPSGSIALHGLFEMYCSKWSDLWECWTPEGTICDNNSGFKMEEAKSINSLYLYLSEGVCA